jgi:hypothetical protein
MWTTSNQRSVGELPPQTTSRWRVSHARCEKLHGPNRAIPPQSSSFGSFIPGAIGGQITSPGQRDGDWSDGRRKVGRRLSPWG